MIKFLKLILLILLIFVKTICLVHILKFFFLNKNNNQKAIFTAYQVAQRH